MKSNASLCVFLDVFNLFEKTSTDMHITWRSFKKMDLNKNLINSINKMNSTRDTVVQWLSLSESGFHMFLLSVRQ